MDKYVRYHKEKVYACFVDSFRKAFDSVWREGLFYKLLKTNIEVNLYSLMKSLYCDSTYVPSKSVKTKLSLLHIPEVYAKAVF